MILAEYDYVRVKDGKLVESLDIIYTAPLDDYDIDDAKRCGDTLVKMTELPKHLKKLYEEIEDVNS